MRLGIALIATPSRFRQCRAMRKIITICVTCILLFGCESDFDKCMRTELPRANSDLQLDSARETLANLNADLTKNQIALSARELFNVWFEANPSPVKHPEFPKYEPPPIDDNYDRYLAYLDQHETKKKEYETAKASHYELPEVIVWGEKRDAAFLNAYKEVGVLVGSREELDKWHDFGATNKLLMARAKRNDCWGEEDCTDPILAEWDKYDFDEYLTIDNALTESIEWQEEELSRLEKLAPETAVRACNANGFYE